MKITLTESAPPPVPTIQWSDIKPNSVYRHRDGSIVVVPSTGPQDAIGVTTGKHPNFTTWGFSEGDTGMWECLTPIHTSLTLTLSFNE